MLMLCWSLNIQVAVTQSSHPSWGAIVNNDQHRAARYGKVRGKRKRPILRGNRRLRLFLWEFWLSDMDSNHE